LYDAKPFTLAENEHRREGILINVPRTAATGQYIFGVEVLIGSGEKYGNRQLMVVDVP
jgi:hypothetical protein